jgi:hypothetical protein
LFFHYHYFIKGKTYGKPKRFKIINTTVFTPPRRFDNKGVMYMMRLMIKSFLNRNNKQFFSDDNTYWK